MAQRRSDITELVDMDFIQSRCRVSESGCWEWQRAKCRSNCGRRYGHFNVILGGRLKTIKAHRAAYELATGDSLGSMECLHACDNTICCNPEHLSKGSHRANMEDMRLKGRAVGHPGRSNPNAKLTEAEVIEIRATPRKSLGGATNAELALRYGVNQATVARLRVGLRGRYAKEVCHRTG